MIRLLSIGAAVVAVAAVKQKRGRRQESQGDAPREAPIPVPILATPAVETLEPQPQEEAPLAKPAPTTTVLMPTAPRPVYPPGAQLLLRLVVSLLAAALLHYVLGRETPWSSLLITCLALFVLTEHLYRVSESWWHAAPRWVCALLTFMVAGGGMSGRYEVSTGRAGCKVRRGGLPVCLSPEGVSFMSANHT